MTTKYETFRLSLALDIQALVKGGRGRSQSALKLIAEGLRKLHDLAVSEKGSGKFLGHYPRWSRTVVEDHNDDSSIFSDKVKRKKYRHEHVVPVATQAKILLSMSQKSTVEEIFSVMDQYGIVAIITREEDRLLPKSMCKGWDYTDTSIKNLWFRYVTAGIFDDMVSH